MSAHLETDADATVLERQLLGEVVSALEFLYAYLVSLTYPTMELQAVQEASNLALGLGIRQVKAAMFEVAQGWIPECAVHVRAAWEIGMDLAFLLSKGGRERVRLAVQDLEMAHLRNPQMRQRMTNPSRFAAAGGGPNLAHWRATMALYEGSDLSGALNPRNHWSGKGKGEIRRAAEAYLDHIAVQPFETFKDLKKVLFDDLGSLVVHGDPGTAPIVPLVEKGNCKWLNIEAVPGHAHAVASSVSFVGVTLLFAGAQRAATEHKNRAKQLSQDLGKVVHFRRLVYPPAGGTDDRGETIARGTSGLPRKYRTRSPMKRP
jgi:hypothetical protein